MCLKKLVRVLLGKLQDMRSKWTVGPHEKGTKSTQVRDAISSQSDSRVFAKEQCTVIRWQRQVRQPDRAHPLIRDNV